jgi:pyrimidine operon attenuation protein/uracil phosphoribosyltransferase
MSSNLNEFERLKDEYSLSREDYVRSIEMVNKFFNKYIIGNIHRSSWDLCIRIERRGSQLYRNQKLSKIDLKLLCDFSSNDLKNNKKILKNKSLLIFDDSIKTGRNIRQVLESDNILNLASKITVAVLLSRSDTIKKLKIEFPQVKFYSEIEASEEDFSREYLKNIQPALDFICFPLQRDHPLLTIDFDEPFDEDLVVDTFNRYGHINSDGYKNYARNGCDKKLFEFKKEVIDELPIFENLKQLNVVHKNIKLDEVVIIRLYIRKAPKAKMIMQPIFLEGVMTYKNDQLIIGIDNYIKNQVIYQFLIKKILFNLINVGLSVTRFSVILK